MTTIIEGKIHFKIISESMSKLDNILNSAEAILLSNNNTRESVIFSNIIEKEK